MTLRRTVTLVLAAAALSLPPATAGEAAEYQGRIVDGRTYHGTASTNDFGRFEGLEIRFQGDRAYLQVPAGGRIVVTLDDEHITDPHAIPAYDHRRGIRWEIEVLDLGSR